MNTKSTNFFKHVLKLLVLILMSLISANVLAQGNSTSLTGSGSANSTTVNAAVAVDNAITITGSTNISGAFVFFTSGFTSGDILGYGTLPSGVSAAYNSGTGVLTFTGTATAANYQFLLRTVTFSTGTSTSSIANRSIKFVLGTKKETYNGHAYQYVASSTNWTSAFSAAAAVSNGSLSGYLVTITSAGENTYASGLTSGNTIFTGLSDNYTYINAATGSSTYANQGASEGNFYLINGPEAGTLVSVGSSPATVQSGQYANWGGGQPDNYLSAEHYGESSSGTWNDIDNTTNRNYMIEFGWTSTDLDFSRDVSIGTSLIGTNTPVAYQMNSSAIVVDNGIELYSGSSVTGTKVTISSGFQSSDVLSYTGALPSGVTASYNSSTGVLTFSGTAIPSDWQALLRTVTYANTNVSQRGLRTITFSLGTNIANSNGHFYQYVSGSYTWTSAKSSAAGQSYFGMTGYLATASSASENSFIFQKLSSNAWMGGSDEYSQINAATGTTTYANQGASEGNWYWVTGPEAGGKFSIGNVTPVTQSGWYGNWNSGEPNNAGGSEHYLEMYASGGGNWNDLPNSSTLGYVVEFGDLGGDPVIDITHTRSVVTPIILTSNGTYSTAANWNLTTVPITTDSAIINANGSVDNNYTIKDLTINSGYTLTINSGKTLTITGRLTNNGTVSGSGYVVLAGTTAQTIYGNGNLGCIRINNSNGVTHNASTVVVSGNLDLQAGTFDLTGKTLKVGGAIDRTSGAVNLTTGTLELNGDGTFSQAFGGTDFSGNLYNLTINNSASGAVIDLVSAVNVDAALTLASGMLGLNSYNLTLASAANLTGGSAASFIYTGGTGALFWQNCAAGSSRIFPVGHTASSTGYAPVTLAFNSGHTTDNFSVVAVNKISNDGTRSGSAFTTRVVKSMWFIEEGVSGGSNVNIKLQWEVTNEGTLFSRSKTQLYHYNAASSATNKWEPKGLPNLAVSGSNPFSVTSANYTGTFSPFGLGGDSLTPLPVNPIEFKGKTTTSGNVLSWTNASEEPGTKYVLERSENGLNFNSINKTTGKVIFASATAYNFIDAISENQNMGNYYQLWMILNNGERINEGIVYLTNTGLRNTTVKVFPNPSSNGLYSIFNPEADGQIVEYTIFNSGGMMIQKGTMPANSTLQTNMSAGVYLLKMQYGDKIKTIYIIR